MCVLTEFVVASVGFASASGRSLGLRVLKLGELQTIAERLPSSHLQGACATTNTGVPRRASLALAAAVFATWKDSKNNPCRAPAPLSRNAKGLGHERLAEAVRTFDLLE